AQERAGDERVGPVHGARARRGDVTGAAAVKSGVRGADHDRPHERGGETAERERQVDRPPQRPRGERLHQAPGGGGAEHHQHRPELAVLDVRRGNGRGRRKYPGHGALPCAEEKPCVTEVTDDWVPGWGGTGSVECTCTRVRWTAGLMTSSAGLGYTPRATISAINGPTAHSSRGLRACMAEPSSRSGPVIVRWYIHSM